MTESKRTKVVGPASRACGACPWRRSNQGRRTRGGWYAKANLRRLWSAMRSGEAPGMTCHPTDPDNPPTDDGRQAPKGTETRECYGAVLLIAREVKLAEGLVAKHGPRAFGEYRKLRPKGLTRGGMAHWIFRFAMGGTPLTGAVLPTTIDEDDGIGHPDFERPEID